jgi:hypothetical protein
MFERPADSQIKINFDSSILNKKGNILMTNSKDHENHEIQKIK